MKAKKILALALCAVMLVCISVGATVAYMTSITETVTNTFTVGDIKIKLDETDVTLYGVKDTDERVIENEYKLIPDHTYIKDPTVHVEDNVEPCYVFVEVANGFNAVEGLESDADDYVTVDEQILGKGWTELEAGVYYKELIPAEGKDTIAKQDLVVFENFRIDESFDVQKYADYANLKITVKAYAIQSDGFNGDVDAAWDAVKAADTTTTNP